MCAREAHLYFSVSHSKALLEEWFGFADHCCEGYCLLNKFDVQDVKFVEKEKREKQFLEPKKHKDEACNL